MTLDPHAPGAGGRLGAPRLAEPSDPTASAAVPAPRLSTEPASTAAATALAGLELDGVARRTIPGAVVLPGLGQPAPGVIAATAPLAPSLPLEPEQLDRLGSLLKLLSDRTRLSILQLLCGGEMNVTALCRALRLPQPTVSHHLGLLRMKRVISNRRAGKQVYYKLHERLTGTPAPSARTDGAASPEAQPGTGLQIADAGFSIQITPNRSTTNGGSVPARAGAFSKIEKKVLSTPRA